MIADQENGVNKPAPSGKCVVYACSGCSDAGELADRTARHLARDGVAEMSCIAGIGGRVKPLTMKAGRAGRVLVIDGCPLACAKHTMELAGYSDFLHLNLADLGVRKGRCPVTEAAVAATTSVAAGLLAEAAVGTLPGGT